MCQACDKNVYILLPEMHLQLMVVALVAAAHAASVSMAGLHVQGNALVNGDGVGVLIHVRASLLLGAPLLTVPRRA